VQQAHQSMIYLFVHQEYLHEGNSYPIFFQLLSFCTACDKTELQVVMSDEGESIKLPPTFGSVAGLAPDL
jgi:hypothetical protein